MKQAIELFLCDSQLAHDIADLLQAAGVEPYMQADSSGVLFVFNKNTIWSAVEDVLDEHASEVRHYASADDFVNDTKGQYAYVVYKLAPVSARAYLERILQGANDEAEHFAENAKRVIAVSIFDRIQKHSGDDPRDADIILARVSNSVL